MFDNNNTYSIKVSTILYTVLILVGLYLSLKVINILLIIFFSYILAVALNPFVAHLEKKKIPRNYGSLIVIVPVLFIILGSLGLVLKITSDELTLFVRDFPTIIASLFNNSDIVQIESTPLSTFLQSELKEIYSFLSNAIVFILFIIFTFVIVLYMLIDYKNLKDGIISLFSENEFLDIEKLIGVLEQKLGSWVRGQVFLMFIVGLATYVALAILGFRYALPLALISGIFEIIPIIGPILAAIPAIIIGFNDSFVSGIAVSAIYFIIQQLEYQLLVPKIMQKAVDQNPLLTLISVLIGQTLFGILGALIAVPAVVILTEIIYNIKDKKNSAR